MNQYIGQVGAQAGCGQKLLDPRSAAQGLKARDPKVLEQIGGHLVMIRDRINMTISRCESISNRAFGVLEEIAGPSPAGVSNPVGATESPGSVPSIQKLLVELDTQISVLNKSIDKVETLA